MRLAAVLTVVGVIGVGALASTVTGRVARVKVEFPQDQPGDTWVLVGSDDRARLETDAQYLVGEGSPDGARADIVMAVRRIDGVTTSLAVPRDVIVGSASGSPVRLTHTLDPDPQELVDALCVDLGIAADHLVIMDMEGLIDLVDSMGGIDVELEHAVKDEAAGLALPAGPQRLDGDSALALVRSREGTRFEGGRWVEADDGVERRMRAGAVVQRAIGDRIRSLWRNPARLPGSAWAASDAVTLDSRSALFGLVGLGAPERTMVLPTGDDLGGLAIRPADDASEVISEFTAAAGCRL